MQHADFERVNGLLASVEAQVKAAVSERLASDVDRHLTHPPIDDIVAMWNISRARDAAWVNAETLWAIRDDTDLTNDYLSSLDRMTGFAGRGLLVPADTWGEKLARLLEARRMTSAGRFFPASTRAAVTQRAPGYGLRLLSSGAVDRATTCGL